jgi:hypothetical protein
LEAGGSIGILCPGGSIDENPIEVYRSINTSIFANSMAISLMECCNSMYTCFFMLLFAMCANFSLCVTELVSYSRSYDITRHGRTDHFVNPVTHTQARILAAQRLSYIALY